MLDDVVRLRELGWSWTRIGAHYRVSEREVRRWVSDGRTPERLPAPPLALNWATAIILNDIQYPFWNPAVFEVAVQVARDAEVDRVIWDGDNLDFPQLSRFTHNPYLLSTARKDVAGFHAEVRTPLLNQVPTITAEDWNDGNHEWRYERYYQTNAPALEDSLQPPQEFLRLPDGVRYRPYEKARGLMLTPRLLVSHGWYARKHSAYTARAHAEDVGGGVSVITGHTHRIGCYMHSTPHGVVQAWEVGHMCDPSVIPKAVPGQQNWQLVAGTVVRYERDGPGFHVELCEVVTCGGDANARQVVLANGREYVLG